MAEVDELAVIARQMLQPVIRGLDEDVGFVSGGPQDALNAEHFVADRIAVAERREHLMDAGSHARLRSTSYSRPRAGPFGSVATICSAGGQSVRRRSYQPGSGSKVCIDGSFERRPNISRYFRSITGQS